MYFESLIHYCVNICKLDANLLKKFSTQRLKKIVYHHYKSGHKSNRDFFTNFLGGWRE